MIEKILESKEFIALMQKQCYEVIKCLIKQKVEFCIVANTDFVDFNPALPGNLDLSKNAYTLFALAGYTFESINLEEDKLHFHAGFGVDDFASFVSVDLGAITQIQVHNEVIFVNFSFYKRKIDEQSLTKNSMDIFLNNPKNKDNLKK